MAGSNTLAALKAAMLAGKRRQSLGTDHRSAEADLEFTKGVALEDVGQFTRAERIYRGWLTAFGDDADVYFNLANVLRRLGNDEASIAYYRQAIALRPDFAEAWLNLGDALAQLHRYGDAVDVNRRAVQLNPANGDALYNLAHVLDDLGHPEAYVYWRRFLQAEPVGEAADFVRRRLVSA